MSLNPLRETLKQAGFNAFGSGDGFKPVTDAALSDFGSIRTDLERKVKRGELTVKVAREQAAAAATRFKDDLLRKTQSQSETPRVFLHRLVDTINQRKKSRESMSLEGLQRETNKMLRQLLVEQQLQTREVEFEAKTYVRAVSGGDPVPTLDNLLTFHESATNAGDEAAREWARRKLEEYRARTIDSDDHRRIDLACDRPEQINPRLASRYVEAMKTQDSESQERFLAEAVASKDANACVAAFLLARGSEEGTKARWVRLVLNAMSEFPDAALQSLRGFEAEILAEEAESARRHALFAIGLMEADARLSDVQAPTQQEVEKLTRLESKPAARPGEAIGLALDRRGLLPEDNLNDIVTDAEPVVD